MFRPFRQLLESAHGIGLCLENLSAAVRALIQVQETQGPARERLELLEQSRHQFEALCEGLLLKAEGKLRAANNAEARERQMKKSYEHLLDPLAEEGVEPEATGSAVPVDDAAPSEADRLLGLRMAVASTNSKTLAQRAKFGVR